jgi:hypothetical protein
LFHDSPIPVPEELLILMVFGRKCQRVTERLRIKLWSKLPDLINHWVIIIMKKIFFMLLALLTLTVNAVLAASTSTTISPTLFTILAAPPVGTIRSETLSITIKPDSSMVGQPGSLFVSALMPDGVTWYSNNGSGWQLWNSSSTMPPYSTSTSLPATSLITPINNMDLSPFVGSKIYAGYGSTYASMQSNGTYVPVFVVTQPAATLSSTGAANSTGLVNTGIGYTQCTGQYALCAASTCTATGNYITNNLGQIFPAVSCTCPILTGSSYGSLTGGNVAGSCTSTTPGVVYSFFGSATAPSPQNVNGVWTANVTMTPQVCGASNKFSQCFSWACTTTTSQNGIALATCTCPMEQTSIPFVASAGQGNPAACQQMPVGGPVLDPAYE